MRRVIGSVGRGLIRANGLSKIAPFVVGQAAVQLKPVWSTARYQTTAGGGRDPKAVAAETRTLLRHLPLGCIVVNSLNIETEISASPLTPMVLYFHSPSDATVLAYTKAVLSQVAAINASHSSVGTDASGAATGTTKIALRCGLIDCERDWALAQQFRIQPDLFPLMYFVLNGQVVDKMYQIHPESQVQQAFTAFIAFAKEKAGARKQETAEAPPSTVKGPTPKAESRPSTEPDRPDRVDEFDENAMTLQAAAIRKTQAKEYPKAFELFTKARTIAESEVQKLKIKLGVQNKKLTPEINEKLRKDPNYLALPQTICGQAMVRLAQKQTDEAFAYCQEVRKLYPWAVRDNRQIADTMCRVEIIKLSGFDVDKDNYVTLMKNDELLDDPAEFYNNQLRLAVAHYFERHPEIAVEELLKLIRAEAKLLPALQKANAIPPPPEGSVATPQNRTPARRVIFLLFEALGNDHAVVVDARKKLAAFLFA